MDILRARQITTVPFSPDTFFALHLFRPPIASSTVAASTLRLAREVCELLECDRRISGS